jgi:hypothetical protein
MKESYMEALATHHGLEPYADRGNTLGVASARGSVGRLLSSDIFTFACRSCSDKEKATSSPPLAARRLTDAAESKNLCMRRHSKRENRETLSVSLLQRRPIAVVENDQRTSPGARLI